jgi:hypothetical protein
MHLGDGYFFWKAGSIFTYRCEDLNRISGSRAANSGSPKRQVVMQHPRAAGLDHENWIVNFIVLDFAFFDYHTGALQILQPTDIRIR